jgi:hypothetical protein
MSSILALIAFALTLAQGQGQGQSQGQGQGTPPPVTAAPSPTMGMQPPKELQAVNFLIGEFDVEMKFFEPGKDPVTTTGTVFCSEALGGMYLESTHTYDMGEMSMEGRHFLTYDPAKKKYIGYWFDQAAPGAMEMSGSLKSNALLVMISKPTAVPGMPGLQTFRSTWSVKSDTTIKFLLEVKAGKKWTTVIDGVMTRR